MTAAAALGTVQHVHAATILERAVCLLLTCGYVGNTRKVELDA